MAAQTVAESLAQAVADADVRTVTFVPGFGASETFEAVRRRLGRELPLSFHEEVAFSVAFGSALRGRRAVALVKTHGLLKAANAVAAALSCGTTAAMSLWVFDDPEGRHSDNILDAEVILNGLGLSWTRLPASGARDAALEVLAKSETTGLPHALLIDADSCAKPDPRTLPLPLPLPAVEPAATAVLGPPPPYRRDAARHLVCPFLTRYQRAVLDARRAGANPDSVPRPDLPRIPDDAPERWHSTLRAYGAWFCALRETAPAFVAGDTGLSGLFGLPPFDSVDVICHMGGSVPLAVGAQLAGQGPVWAVSGDFSFVAAGHLGLLEAVTRNAPIKVAVFVNGRSEATGGQPVSAELVRRVLSGYADLVTWVDRPWEPSNSRAAIRDALAAEGPRVLVLDFREGLG